MASFAYLVQVALLLVATIHASPLPRSSATTLLKRATIASSKIVGLTETIPDGHFGDLYKAYQPYLKVRNGCVPFPAVDIDGNTNEGLPLIGSGERDCTNSTGQVYVRGTQTNGSYALMYSWYMPKDSPSMGLGHRHEWEGVIIHLSTSNSTAASNIKNICPSAHGNWECTSVFRTTDSGAWIDYFSLWPVNHQMWAGVVTQEGRGKQPLVAWESLSPVVRNALEVTDFGSATVPFKESTFEENLAKAT